MLRYIRVHTHPAMPPRGQKTTAVPADGAAPATSERTSTQFTDSEVAEMLATSIIQRRKPIGNDMWREVETALASTRPGFTQRNALSLKQKFTRLQAVYVALLFRE